jgi:hypothetical protein
MIRNVLRFVLLLALAASSVAVGGPAWAGCCLEAMSDGQDVDGRLDLARLRYDKSGSNAPMHVKIRTHESWKPSVLEGHENKLRVIIDADEDGSADYRARIRRVEGQFAVYMSGSGGEQFETLTAHKPKPDSIRFTIPGGAPMNPGGTVNMKAVSTFIETLACDPASGNPPCVDRVPNAGWL